MGIAKSLKESYHFLMFFLIMGAFVPLWREASGVRVDPAEGDPFTRGLLALGYGIAVFWLLQRPKAFFRTLLRSPWIWLLLLWSFLSTAWSVAPEVTLRKAAAVTLVTLYALLVAMEFSLAAFLRFLGKVVFFVLILSLLLVFLLPSWGVMGDPHPGAWRGVFLHKNTLGRAAAFALFLFAMLILSDRRLKGLWILGFGLAALNLLGSRSATSLVLGLTTVSLVGLLWWGRGLRAYWFLGVLLVGTIATIFASQGEAYYLLAIEALGKDPTLTGRVPLWQALWPYVLERFWTGYGLGGFWLGLEGPSASVWSMVGWEVPHAHNGYLDLWLDLGMVGVIIAIFMGVNVFRWAIQGYMRLPLDQLYAPIFWLGLLGFLAILNLAESNLVRANNLFWFLFSLGYLASSLTEREVYGKRAQYPR